MAEEAPLKAVDVKRAKGIEPSVLAEPGFFGKIKAAWLRWVIRTFIERIPILKKLFGMVDGYKVLIGRIGVALSIILYMLAYSFPQIPHIAEVYSVYAMMLAWVFQELGIQHDLDKEKRRELLDREFGGR